MNLHYSPENYINILPRKDLYVKKKYEKIGMLAMNLPWPLENYKYYTPSCQL